MTYQPTERIDRALPLATAAREHPELDVASLLELFDGSTEAVASLLEVAARSIEGDLERIEAATLAGDAAAAAQAAHRLKGTSGSITATRVSAISSAIERAAEAQSPAAGTSLLLDLRVAVESIVTAVAAYTGGAAPTAAVARA